MAKVFTPEQYERKLKWHKDKIKRLDKEADFLYEEACLFRKIADRRKRNIQSLLGLLHSLLFMSNELDPSRRLDEAIISTRERFKEIESSHNI